MPQKGDSSGSTSEDGMMTERSFKVCYKICFMLSQNFKLRADLMKTPGPKITMAPYSKGRLIKIKIVSFFSVDHNDIFDHKYCIDPGNLLNI